MITLRNNISRLRNMWAHAPILRAKATRIPSLNQKQVEIRRGVDVSTRQATEFATFPKKAIEGGHTHSQDHLR
jgi:hypothetical protein